MFAVSFFFISQLNYVTPVSRPCYFSFAIVVTFEYQGKSKSAKEVLKRIDYGGTVTLFGAVSTFIFTNIILTHLHIGSLNACLPEQ